MIRPAPRARIDWKSERDGIDLAAVATDLLDPAPGRRGERGRKLWWSCPLGTHEDKNPSFCIEPGKGWWKCWGCGESGDAAALVMRIENVTFPEAVAILTGNAASASNKRTRQRPERVSGVNSKGKSNRADLAPSGLPEADALALVEAAEARLWTPEGADALAYLTGPSRGLTPETIRKARLGWTPRALGVAWEPPGVVIPWFLGGRLAMFKVRLDDGWRARYHGKRRPPKYLEGYRDPGRLVCYPGSEVVQAGRTLIVTEGELDALCLGGAIGDLASVMTLGSASTRPTPDINARFLGAARWYLATDQDAAGDLAAASWPARARRVRPPGSFKDWADARAGGVDLARWWWDILAGIERPPLFTWEELAGWRWGESKDDPAPGIDLHPPIPPRPAQDGSGSPDSPGAP